MNNSRNKAIHAKMGKKPEKAKSKGHKHAEREAQSKKAGFYVHGHKNFGDVYEA